MRVSSYDLEVLDEVLRAARLRVLHIIALVALPVVAISIAAATSASQVRLVPEILFWVVGCCFFGGFALLSYRSRVAAIQRLRHMVETGTPRLVSVEVTRVALEHIIPFGYEIDIESSTGDRLAFGFWTRRTAERLLELLQHLID